MHYQADRIVTGPTFTAFPIIKALWGLQSSKDILLVSLAPFETVCEQTRTGRMANETSK